MTPTFYDLVTGKTAKGKDFSVYWWMEGNGSCDCNRACSFPEAEEEMEARQRKAHPELKEWQSLCFGCKRFIAIDVEGDLNSYDYDGKDPQPMTKEEILKAMNAYYPKHSSGCGNQNLALGKENYPVGMFLGVQECGCRDSR